MQQIENRGDLSKSCAFALLGGGKRFRSSLVLMLGESLGFGFDTSESAVAVELFHAASLVADDLPCMDDETERRGQPTVHVVYGEAVALLSTYALIAAGYECLWRNAEVLKQNSGLSASQADALCVLALQNVAHNAGIQGAAFGQYLDLFPPDKSKETVLEVIRKKTGTLFEISFVLGWLFGGGDLEKLQTVKEISAHFSLAFQVADDLGDLKQDAENNAAINYAAILGKEQAIEVFHVELLAFRRKIKSLSLNPKLLLELSDHLETLLPFGVCV